MKTPEWPHCSAHPDIEAAFLRQSCGEFTHHEPGRQRPNQRREAYREQSEFVARILDQLFQAERAAGNHEIRCRSQRKQAKLAAGESLGFVHCGYWDYSKS